MSVLLFWIPLKILTSGRPCRGAFSPSAHGIPRYSVHPTAFQPVQQWLAQVEELWRGQLHAFKSYAENSQRGRKPKT
jgi:hypothetical protein